MSQWQPIETAPRDCRILIKTDSGNQYVGQWCKNVELNKEAFKIAELDIENQFIIDNAVQWKHLQ